MKYNMCGCRGLERIRCHCDDHRICPIYKNKKPSDDIEKQLD